MLAIFHFIIRMAASVETREVTGDTLEREFAGELHLKRPDGVMVYEIDGPMFFAAIENFERALKHTATDPRALVIRLRRVPFIDATGLQSMDDVVSDLQKRGVQVFLCEANKRVIEKMRRSGVVGESPLAKYCDTLEQAFDLARPLIKPI
jgi:SulP family sulfate permease